MRFRTIVAGVGVLVVLGVISILALNTGVLSNAQFTERWTSDTAVDTQGNHHAPAIATVDGRTMLYAPISATKGTSSCRLAALNATSGTTQWQYPVPSSACAIHAVADPTVSDYDDDGSLEVLAATTENQTVVLNATTGAVERRYDLSNYGYTQPVVTDLTGDGKQELVVADVSGRVFVFRPNGTTVWSRNLTGYSWGQPAVDDFDADGQPEIAVGFSDGQLHLLERDGTRAWERPKELGGSITWMATQQTDGDPAIEIVTATPAGNVTMIDGKTKTTEWQSDFGRFAAVHAVEDGDDDGTVEVYAVARDGNLRSIRASDGRVEWTTTLTTEDVQMMPPPALGDVDGDGDDELVAAGNDGSVSIVDPSSGDVRVAYERETPIFVHPTLDDVDDDGAQEVFVMYSDGRVVSLDTN